MSQCSMSEEEYAAMIEAEGWFRLKRGWYHVDAWDYMRLLKNVMKRSGLWPEVKGISALLSTSRVDLSLPVNQCRGLLSRLLPVLALCQSDSHGYDQ